jgi:hypothetical protein
MEPDTLAGIAGIVIVAYYLLWRFSILRGIFRRYRHILGHRRFTKP